MMHDIVHLERSIRSGMIALNKWYIIFKWQYIENAHFDSYLKSNMGVRTFKWFGNYVKK